MLYRLFFQLKTKKKIEIINNYYGLNTHLTSFDERSLCLEFVEELDNIVIRFLARRRFQNGCLLRVKPYYFAVKRKNPWVGEEEDYLGDGHEQMVLCEVNIFPMGLPLNGGRLSLSISPAVR